MNRMNGSLTAGTGLRIRGRRWVRWLLAAFLWLLVVTYYGSYYYLSRRGMAEAERLGLRYFFYVPFEEVARTHDMTWQRRFVYLYEPLNEVDQLWFGGKDPCRHVTW
jgi:hypothetical protein